MNVGIATVVEFLQKKGHTVEANPNTKISEEQYAILVKEFSTDKNLRLESERFIQERQNKERNKASVSIEGFEKQPEKQKSEDVIKTVVPEDARPKFKPVGKIDLDKLNGRKPEKVEKEPEQKQEVPVVERPVVKPEVKKEPEKREPEVKKEEVVIPPVSVVEPTVRSSRHESRPRSPEYRFHNRYQLFEKVPLLSIRVRPGYGDYLKSIICILVHPGENGQSRYDTVHLSVPMGCILLHAHSSVLPKRKDDKQEA